MAFNFEKLEVYNKSQIFAEKIFEITKTFPTSELYGLTSQLRRASLSIPSNIAEGSSRSKKQFCHFLDMARGSVFECVSLLKIAQKENYFSKQSYKDFYRSCESLSMMISALKRSLSTNNER